MQVKEKASKLTTTDFKKQLNKKMSFHILSYLSGQPQAWVVFEKNTQWNYKFQQLMILMRLLALSSKNILIL